MRIVVEPGLAVKEGRGFWVTDLWLSLVGLGKRMESLLVLGEGQGLGKDLV